MKLTVEVQGNGLYTYQCDDLFPPALVAIALRQIADRIDTPGGSPPARSPIRGAASESASTPPAPNRRSLAYARRRLDGSNR